MATYTKRVQTVLTDEQYEALLRIAEERGKPLSVLIREAIEGEYFEKERLRRRRVALKRLLALEAPVADWEEMEAEIISTDAHFDRITGIKRLDPKTLFVQRGSP